jgi:putative flavoprotein involved in K+ transport
MNTSILDVAVIGAGHAGLAISYHLKQNGLNHLVFERDMIGETWRSQRWDTFRLNSANKLNVLPGYVYTGSDPEGFCTAQEFVSQLETYATTFQLPIKEHTQVISVEKPEGAENFAITVSENGVTKQYESKQVVITSGCQNAQKVPSIAANISPDIMQLHAMEYRSASQLPEGAVLVAGSAQSGCQIAEDLNEVGRKVYLATSMVARFPRRYRGRDVIDWLLDMNFFTLMTQDVTDPTIFSMRVPQISGVGPLGHTLSLQSLARGGATILGKIENADIENIYIMPNAQQHVQFADGFSQKVKAMVDEFIEKNHVAAPPPEEDIYDVPDPSATCASTATSLNLKEHNITSIIWATGFIGNFDYLKVPVFDAEGNPKHTNGIAPIDGLYFLGFPWLRMRKSGMVFGINDDAAFISEAILNEHNKKGEFTPKTQRFQSQHV